LWPNFFQGSQEGGGGQESCKRGVKGTKKRPTQWGKKGANVTKRSEKATVRFCTRCDCSRENQMEIVGGQVTTRHSEFNPLTMSITLLDEEKPRMLKRGTTGDPLGAPREEKRKEGGEDAYGVTHCSGIGLKTGEDDYREKNEKGQ